MGGSNRSEKSKDHAVQRKIVRNLIPFVITAICVSAVLIPVYAFRDTTELTVYLQGARNLVEGIELYGLAGDAPPFAYPPLFALITTPLLVFTEHIQRTMWCAIQITLAIGLIWVVYRIIHERLLGKTSQRTAKHTLILFWFFYFGISIRFIVSPLENQSHDYIVAILVGGAAYFSCRGMDVRSGIALGIAAALKATPLLFLPMFLVQRRWAGALAMVVTLSTASIIPDLTMQRNDAQWNIVRWVQIATGAAKPGQSGGKEIWQSWNHLNQNLAGTVYRLTSPPPRKRDVSDVSMVTLSPHARSITTAVFQLCIFILVIGGIMWMHCRPPPASPEYAISRLLEFGIVACGMILLSPMSSKAHYCVLTIGIAAVVCEFIVRRDWRLGTALCIMFVLNTLTAKDIVGKHSGDVLLAVGVPTWSCVLLLATCLYSLHRVGPAKECTTDSLT